MKYQVETTINDKVFSIQTGQLARQADGAVVVGYGDNMVLTAVVIGEPRQNGEFDEEMLPLTVEYREKTSAAGKIPGGFFKREGRPTTEEILTMRLIDRPLRPLFPQGFSNEIQIMSFVLSADKSFDPDILAINGASAALMLTGIPFQGPIGAVRIGYLNNKFLLNPTLAELQEGMLDLIVAGTEDAIIMVEGSAKEVSEETLLEAIKFGHQNIKPLVQLQKKLHEKLGNKPSEKVAEKTPFVLDGKIIEEIRQKIYDDLKKKIQIRSKQERRDALNEVKDRLINEYAPAAGNEEKATALKKLYGQLEREIARELILAGKRIDGRGLTDIRPIHCEVGLLPRTHGSALFTRGETQALVVVTLGTGEDEQIIDGLADEYKKKFMLHYNFPPFSVGEIKPNRGPSRREIGHGHLAERAITAVLPPIEQFPYTIRVVSDILESNGSSSMATVCGATLSMMDAGVLIKAPVAGIAMGLVKEKDKVRVLSDILGNEDKYGDMDFKVAGTTQGITAFQMDIKVKEGLSMEILKTALAQAREGRLFILQKMSEALAQPRAMVSKHAPKIVRIKIKPEKIGMVIGTGGKTIRKIEEETGATLEINDSGEVFIYATEQASIDKAKQTVESLTEEVEVGKIYQGKVTGIKDFGAFVEVLPGQEGLVHISELADGFVKSVTDVVKLGDTTLVKVIGVDEQNRIRLSRKQAMPEGTTGASQPRADAEPKSHHRYPNDNPSSDFRPPRRRT